MSLLGMFNSRELYSELDGPGWIENWNGRRVHVSRWHVVDSWFKETVGKLLLTLDVAGIRTCHGHGKVPNNGTFPAP